MLILGGREVATKCESVNWTETGLTFDFTHCYARGASRVTIGTLHWTGGEGNASGVHTVLKQRGLSVDFCVESSGRIVQYTDPVKLATWHAGSINRRAWGVEIINGGVPSLAAKARTRSKQMIHGTLAEYADFYPAQIEAVKELLEVVNGFLGIPMRVPRTPVGGLLETVMRPQDLAVFSGVVGHYHVTKSKLDPGTEVFWSLAKAGIQWV